MSSGAAGIARFHSNGYSALPSVQLVAAADISREALGRMALEIIMAIFASSRRRGLVTFPLTESGPLLEELIERGEV